MQEKTVLNTKLQGGQSRQGDDRTPDKPIGEIAYAEKTEQQLDEGKVGHESGNEMSANTDPTTKKTGEF